MNKKLNTALFLAGATVLNILIMFVVFLTLLVVFLKFIQPHVSAAATQWAALLIFVLALGLSLVIYQGIMKIFTGKVDMEKYFEPIFAPKRRYKKTE
jgi:hypothetical protein